MATGSVNRHKWATAVRRLMDKHASGRKATFAKLVGVDPRTVSFWLDEQFTVRESIVRQVADKTGESAIDLLIEVGVFSRGDIPAPDIAPEDEWIVRMIQSSAMDQAKKNMMIAVELDRAKREREEKARRIKEQIEMVAGPSDSDE